MNIYFFQFSPVSALRSVVNNRNNLTFVSSIYFSYLYYARRVSQENSSAATKTVVFLLLDYSILRLI